MVFSRYSAILLRRLTTNLNNINNNNLETAAIQCKENFLNHEGRKKNCSTLISREKIDEETRLLPHLKIDNVDVDYEYSDILFDVKEKRPGVLEPCVDDLSHIAPNFPLSFNFAAYADKSPMIQKLAELGVDFSKIERRKGLMKFLLPLDFEKDMKYHIRFLNDCGVPADKLGEYLTKNPLIFKEDLDDLHTRIRYLNAHKFTPDMISRIVTKNPFWVMFTTKRIDTRLGFFQKEFQLAGNQVRKLATKLPKLITYNMEHVKENTFAVRELMGFNKSETRMILLDCPNIWIKSRQVVVDTFDYLHNEMKLPHDMIAQQPGILTCRVHRLRERHMFLAAQNKAQYDPTKPMYVSPGLLVADTDAAFCTNLAKTPIETFNMFLKSL